jgi:CheY-like chemotaxis protein
VSEKAGAGWTVLIVDDEPDILLGTRLLLEEAGYTVLEAHGGKEALVVVERARPDAMFLDLRMPGMDGWDVLEALRSNSSIADFPVIVFSAHADPAAVEKSRRLGASAYVRKPFRSADLTRALHEVLPA